MGFTIMISLIMIELILLESLHTTALAGEKKKKFSGIISKAEPFQSF